MMNFFIPARKILPAMLLIFMTCSTTAVRAQWSEGGNRPVYLERHQFQLNLLMPGFTYEFGILPNLTAGATLGLGLATPPEGYSLAPSYLAFSRYYHNLKRRAGMGKNVSGNSGNYFSIGFGHYFVEWELAGNLDNEGRDLIFLGGLYGIQRSYPGGLTLGIEAGAGQYFRNRISNGFGPVVHFRLGWDPFKRKRDKKPPWPPQD